MVGVGFAGFEECLWVEFGSPSWRKVRDARRGASRPAIGKYCFNTSGPHGWELLVLDARVHQPSVLIVASLEALRTPDAEPSSPPPQPTAQAAGGEETVALAQETHGAQATHAAGTHNHQRRARHQIGR